MGCGKCFYKETACFFFLSSGRKEELQRSNIAAKGRCATLVRWPSLSRFQWNESLQFKRLLTIQGTVLVQCMLSCFGRKTAASAAFGASFSNLVAKKASTKHKRLVTKCKGPQKGERREVILAFLWTTAFLFLLPSRFQCDVTSEPPKTANRAQMTTRLGSTSFYTITTIAFNICIKLFSYKDTHFLPAQHRSVPSMLLFPRSIAYFGSPHSFVQGHLV